MIKLLISAAVFSLLATAEAAQHMEKPAMSGNKENANNPKSASKGSTSEKDISDAEEELEKARLKMMEALEKLARVLALEAKTLKEDARANLNEFNNEMKALGKNAEAVSKKARMMVDDFFENKLEQGEAKPDLRRSGSSPLRGSSGQNREGR